MLQKETLQAMKILSVEDEPGAARFLERALYEQNCVASIAGFCADAGAKFPRNHRLLKHGDSDEI